MQKMKDSGVAWIGEIPEGWEVCKLGLQVQFINGFAFKSEDLNIDNDNPVIRIGDIKDGTVSYDDALKCKDSRALFPYLIKKNDIAIAMSGATVGKTGFCNQSPTAYINQRVGLIRGNSKFYYYILNTPNFSEYIELLSAGSAQPNISQSQICNFRIPLIDKETKEHIIAYLDHKTTQIDTTIAQHKAQIDKLKEYRQSVITEAVTKGLDASVSMKDSGVEWIGDIPEGWEVRKLKFCAQLTPRCKTDNLSANTLVTFLPMEYIKNGYYKNNNTEYNKCSISYNIFQNGDILIAKVTPCFENGNIAIAKNLTNNFGFGSSELFVIRPYKIDTKFLFYFLQNIIFKDKCKSEMIGAGGLKRVPSSIIANYQLASPSPPEQQAIADYLDTKTAQINKAITTKDALITKLTEYKQALIYEAVTGKMGV